MQQANYILYRQFDINLSSTSIKYGCLQICQTVRTVSSRANVIDIHKDGVNSSDGRATTQEATGCYNPGDLGVSEGDSKHNLQ